MIRWTNQLINWFLLQNNLIHHCSHFPDLDCDRSMEDFRFVTFSSALLTRLPLLNILLFFWSSPCFEKWMYCACFDHLFFPYFSQLCYLNARTKVTPVVNSLFLSHSNLPSSSNNSTEFDDPALIQNIEKNHVGVSEALLMFIYYSKPTLPKGE